MLSVNCQKAKIAKFSSLRTYIPVYHEVGYRGGNFIWTCERDDWKILEGYGRMLKSRFLNNKTCPRSNSNSNACSNSCWNHAVPIRNHPNTLLEISYSWPSEMLMKTIEWRTDTVVSPRLTALAEASVANLLEVCLYHRTSCEEAATALTHFPKESHNSLDRDSLWFSIPILLSQTTM